ncbi:MAG: class I SAM-dependent methyltransferase, partial [Bdellovibrionales bacterium]
VRSRLRLAAQIVQARLPPGQSLLELGCGSGYLAARVKSHCGSYVGIDIAAVAIREARRSLPEPHLQFMQGDIRQMRLPVAELTVLLGLSDWLSPMELKALVARLRSRCVLLSYTRASAWHPYRLYRALADAPRAGEGRSRTRSYGGARTYEGHELAAWLTEGGYRSELIKPPGPLNPGALLWAARD